MYMRHHRRVTETLVCVFLFQFAVHVQAQAGEGACARCGRAAACQKACRLVCEEKAVKIICWGAKHEDFCVPGPSHLGCRFCEQVPMVGPPQAAQATPYGQAPMYGQAPPTVP